MTVCQEFRTVFGNTLTKNAATLKPFELNVDLAKWETPANRSVPRHMCPKKQFEIQRQVTELLAAGIIEHSTASYYSQVILVPTTLRRLSQYEQLHGTCLITYSKHRPDVATFRSKICMIFRYYGSHTGIPSSTYAPCFTYFYGFHHL